MDPDLRPRAPVPRRGGRPCGTLLAARPRRLRGDRGRQRLERRHRRRRRGGWAPRSSPSRAGVRRRRARRARWPPTATCVAVMDGDGSFDPDDLLPLLDDVRSGRADLAVGRRRPVARRRVALARPARQRAGRLRGCAAAIGLAVHDIAPMRVCRRERLLALDVAGPRFGYPVELLQKADRARAGGSPSTTSPTTRAPRAPARRCPARCAAPCAPPATSGGCCRDRARRCWSSPRRPVAGQVKTRLGADIGDGGGRRARRRRAARHPARLREAVGADRLPPRARPATSPARSAAARSRARARRLDGHRRSAGDDLAARLAARPRATRRPGAPVVQIGWTPRSSTPADLRSTSPAALATGTTPSSGRPTDGGWWVLALARPGRRRPRSSACPMSTPDTGRRHPCPRSTAAGSDVGRAGDAARRRHRRRTPTLVAAAGPAAALRPRPGRAPVHVDDTSMAVGHDLSSPARSARRRRVDVVGVGADAAPLPVARLGPDRRRAPTAPCSAAARGRPSTSAAARPADRARWPSAGTCVLGIDVVPRRST